MFVTVLIGKNIKDSVVHGINYLGVDPVGVMRRRRAFWRRAAKIERSEPRGRERSEGRGGASTESKELLVRGGGEKGRRAGCVIWEEGGSEGAK